VTALFAMMLLLGAPDAGAARPPKIIVFDVPHVIEQAAVPERLQAADYPVTVHAVKSTEAPEDLVRWFAAEFRRVGLYRMPQDQLPEPMRSSSMTGLDTTTLVSYTVIFQPNPDHTTTAIISETYLAEHQPPKGAAEIAAVFPGATQVVRSSSEALKTLGYRAAAEPKEVERFYREVLPKAGYQKGEGLSFARPGEQLQIIVRADEQGGSRVTVLSSPR
jgi:hypothetical protein